MTAVEIDKGYSFGWKINNDDILTVHVFCMTNNLNYADWVKAIGTKTNQYSTLRHDSSIHFKNTHSEYDKALKSLFQKHERRYGDYCGQNMNTGYLKGSISKPGYICMFITEKNINNEDSLHSVCTLTFKRFNSKDYLYIDAVCSKQKGQDIKNYGAWRLFLLLKFASKSIGLKGIKLEAVPDENTLNFYRRQLFKIGEMNGSLYKATQTFTSGLTSVRSAARAIMAIRKINQARIHTLDADSLLNELNRDFDENSIMTIESENLINNENHDEPSMVVTNAVKSLTSNDLQIFEPEVAAVAASASAASASAASAAAPSEALNHVVQTAIADVDTDSPSSLLVIATEIQYYVRMSNFLNFRAKMVELVNQIQSWDEMYDFMSCMRGITTHLDTKYADDAAYFLRLALDRLPKSQDFNSFLLTQIRNPNNWTIPFVLKCDCPMVGILLLLMSKEHLVSSFILENAYNELNGLNGLNKSSFVRRGLWYTFYTIKTNNINWGDYLVLIHELIHEYTDENINDLISIYLNKGRKTCYIDTKHTNFFGFLSLFFNININNNEIKLFFQVVRELINHISYLENFNNSTIRVIKDIFDPYLTEDRHIESIYTLLKTNRITKDSESVVTATRIYTEQIIDNKIKNEYEHQIQQYNQLNAIFPLSPSLSLPPSQQAYQQQQQLPPSPPPQQQQQAYQQQLQQQAYQQQLQQLPPPPPPPPSQKQLIAEKKIKQITDLQPNDKITLLNTILGKNIITEAEVEMILILILMPDIKPSITTDQLVLVKKLLDSNPTIETELALLLREPLTKTYDEVKNIFKGGKKNKRTKNRNKQTKNRNKQTKNKNKRTKK